jgi:hypothetical protein
LKSKDIEEMGEQQSEDVEVDDDVHIEREQDSEQAEESKVSVYTIR